MLNGSAKNNSIKADRNLLVSQKHWEAPCCLSSIGEAPVENADSEQRSLESNKYPGNNRPIW